MNPFENVVAKLLEQSGYWVRQNYRVNLSVPDKIALGSKNMPRPEIDVLAWSARDEELLIIECKSYLDSAGVGLWAFDQSSRAIRLFADSTYRALITKRLLAQMKQEKLLPGKKPKVTYGLVCGQMVEKEKSEVEALFKKNHWWLWTPDDVRRNLARLGKVPYENDLVTMMVKLLLRQAK